VWLARRIQNILAILVCYFGRRAARVDDIYGARRFLNRASESDFSAPSANTPKSNSLEIDLVEDTLCMPVYDVANKDYLYTEAWIDKLEVARRFTGISNHRRRSARYQVIGLRRRSTRSMSVIRAIHIARFDSNVSVRNT
jgi:hypothetical protein